MLTWWWKIMNWFYKDKKTFDVYFYLEVWKYCYRDWLYIKIHLPNKKQEFTKQKLKMSHIITGNPRVKRICCRSLPLDMYKSVFMIKFILCFQRTDFRQCSMTLKKSITIILQMTRKISSYIWIYLRNM